MTDKLDTESWYWDRRTQKALYPRRTDDDTVRFVTVWHAQEVESALDSGALVPLEDVGLDRTETTFDLVESFRTPEVATDELDDTGAPEEDSD